MRRSQRAGRREAEPLMENEIEKSALLCVDMIDVVTSISGRKELMFGIRDCKTLNHKSHPNQ